MNFRYIRTRKTEGKKERKKEKTKEGRKRIVLVSL